MYVEVLNEKNMLMLDFFNCGDEGLNNYLKEEAFKDQNEKKCTTTLVLRKYRKQISLLGYYTLKNTSLLFKPDNYLRGLPAIEIVFLAVDLKYQKKGIGRKILERIIYRCIQYSDDFSAIFAIVLSSVNHCVDFYKKCNFADFKSFLELLYDPCRNITTPLFLNLYLEC